MEYKKISSYGLLGSRYLDFDAKVVGGGRLTSYVFISKRLLYTTERNPNSGVIFLYINVSNKLSTICKDITVPPRRV